MPRSIPAIVKPSLLVWGRERSGLTVQQASDKAGVDAAVLRQWESGKTSPTIVQLRSLAGVYKRPLAVFFLAEPPRDFNPQAEFRRLPGLTPKNASPELRNALRAALFRREAARDLYSQLGEEPASAALSATPNENAETVGRRIREFLGVTWDDQMNWSSAYGALNAWRDAVEDSGALVFQTSDVSLEEMRGISIPHGPLPVILLNSSDAVLGRVFSLVHEYVHVLFTNAGHESSAIEGAKRAEDQVLEQASNRITAATLLPREEFIHEAKKSSRALSGDDAALRYLSNKLKVSPEAILRRLLSLDQIPLSLYKNKRKSWQATPWDKRQSSGAPPIEVRILANMGRPFVSLVLEAYDKSAVSSADASDYLGVQIKYFPKLVTALAGPQG